MSDNTKPSRSKNQASTRSLERKKEEHLKKINNQIEEAKDPASYETYN